MLEENRFGVLDGNICSLAFPYRAFDEFALYAISRGIDFSPQKPFLSHMPVPVFL